MNNLTDLWMQYNEKTLEISIALGRTTNIVGEYAEHLINNYLKGTLLEPSRVSADIKTSDGKFYQVKARKLDKITSTSLSVIRSWDFDYLAVILFNKKGHILKSVICPKDIAEKYSVYNKHQNGWVITTNHDFLNNKHNEDITEILKNYNGEYNNNNEIKKTANKNKNIQNFLSKKEAFNILRNNLNKELNNDFFVFSNKNKANNNWWLEPRQELFNNDIYIGLNDAKLKKLYVFKITSNTFPKLDKVFRIRSDKDNRVSISINGSDNILFEDINSGSSNIKFKDYLIKTIDY